MSHFHFDGTSYITTPTTPDLQLTGDVYIETYMRVPEYTGEWRVFLSTCGIETGYLLRQGESSDALEMIHADGSWRTGVGDTGIPPDTWTAVGGNATIGSLFSFWISGIVAGTDAINANQGVPETTVPISIGAYIGGGTPDQFMVGDIWTVKVRPGNDTSGMDLLHFSADDGNVPFDSGPVPDGASWTDLFGRAWTVHGSGITFDKNAGGSNLVGMRVGKSYDVFPGNPEMRIVRGRK